jgi:hypothetical protein
MSNMIPTPPRPPIQQKTEVSYAINDVKNATRALTFGISETSDVKQLREAIETADFFLSRAKKRIDFTGCSICT